MYAAHCSDGFISILQYFWDYMTSPEVGVVPRVVGHDVGVSRVHLLQVERVQDGLLLRRLARLHRPDWERLVPALRLSGVDRRRRVLLLVLKEVKMHSKYFYYVCVALKSHHLLIKTKIIGENCPRGPLWHTNHV